MRLLKKLLISFLSAVVLWGFIFVFIAVCDAIQPDYSTAIGSGLPHINLKEFLDNGVMYLGGLWLFSFGFTLFFIH